MDFYKIRERGRKGFTEIYPDFQVRNLEDLLVKGGKFYAVWDEEKGLWSQDPLTVQTIVDRDIWKYANDLRERIGDGQPIIAMTMESDSSGSWNKFIAYVKRFPDCSVSLDNNLTFQNTKVEKKDYASKRLGYSLEDGDYSAWDKLVGRLYAPKEREKIEWAIGAIVSGDSKKIQKFCVLYGEGGTGKSTIIDIIKKLFDGYYIIFNAKDLGSSNNQFATEVFQSNPLVAIQPDADLSRIEDNTKLNSIIAHEEVLINAKGKTQYSAKMNSFMFLASNKPVKITDGRSGIIRRLIDIVPTGDKFPAREYEALMSQIDFELGAIAKHCLDVYHSLGKNYYRDYRSIGMMMKTNHFYNFVEASIDKFEAQPEGISLTQAYAMYKDYVEDAMIKSEYRFDRPRFREELKVYFESFKEVARVNGSQIRSWYSGFRRDKFEAPVLKKEVKSFPLVLDSEVSLLDDILADCKAQYAKIVNDTNDKPQVGWSYCETKLRDIDTTKLHYVLPKHPDWSHQMIMIDFDIRNAKGEKDMYLNLEAASKWPSTYAEFSKGGGGIHLIYWYDGDVSKLAPLFAPGIEVKVFNGSSSMRRRLTKCNDIPISVINGGLPLKEEKVIDSKVIKSQKKLVEMIKDCLNKKHHGHTKPEIDFIVKILDDAYDSGLTYDVSDLEHDIRVFAMHSSNNADYCKKQIRKMKFRSELKIEDISNTDASDSDSLVFFDIEVFPNLFLVNWKFSGDRNPVHRMINPSPIDIEQLFRFKLVGFNCRKYDNHILYARYLGLSIPELYDLSQRIIVEQAREAFYPEAYNISYTDVFDFSSKKQSLKKFEIELGIHHQELGLPWDQPVPEAMWEKVAEYCDNDVLATEAVFNARKADFTARQILASVAGMTVNDTTNTLTTRIIFGNDRKPQGQFNYRFMGDELDAHPSTDDLMTDKDYTVFDSKGRPIFPGYKYSFGKSIYRGEEVGEGGYVYAEPGIHYDVALLDIASMHPSSIVAEQLFGPVYTQRFHDILNARIAIKHGDFDTARKLLDGKLAPFLKDEGVAKDLAQALKIAINSVYGLTSARFDNPFRDKRNIDNIVAKRGALFMVNLKHEVQARGFTVAHIKTDSIKIPNATPDIIRFVTEYGKLYGYNFEHEATYNRMCLVNDAVYIARYADAEWCQARYGYLPSDIGKHGGEWTATGAQFQQPYVFKTLFSGDPVEFGDLCENKNVTGGAIYLDMNEQLPDVLDQEKALEKLLKKNGLAFEDILRCEAFPEAIDTFRPEIVPIVREALQLRTDISKGHDYHFVGRAGLFCPIQSGYGGGIMYREKNRKYYAISGTKGYRWMESEVVQTIGLQDKIDIRYHDALQADAMNAISKYGDFEQFVNASNDISDDDGVPPFDLVPCGDNRRQTCMECPNRSGDICKLGYSLNTTVEHGDDELPF